MRVKLDKVIEPGSYRDIAQRLGLVDPMKVPIAGPSPEAIARMLGGTIERVGRRSLKNVFVIVAPPWRLMFVRSEYTGYRKAAQRVFNEVDRKIDYDHVLSRAANEILGYPFVLMARLTDRVNRSHGAFESDVIKSENMPDFAFPNMRILDKCLGRIASTRRKNDPERRLPYDATQRASYGLTLKQLGQLGDSFGAKHLSGELCI